MSNNDLISREYLEDAFDNLCCHNCKTCRNFRIEDSFYKCALIDNAPTVETYKEKYEELKEAYKLLSEAYEHEVTKEERPQGEWIFRSGGYYKCSECGEVERAEKNYCSNCGAKMKGGNK